MSDHTTDPHASGQDHGMTMELHSPLGAENSAREKQKWDEFKASIPTDEASIRAAFRKAIDGDALMSIPARPTDADLVLKKAIDGLVEARTLLARIAQAATERDAAEESIRHLHTIDNRRPMRSEELQAHLAQTKEAAIRRHGALARLEEALAEARKAVQR